MLVVNSCARGQATPESDLDMAILVEPTTSPDEILNLEALWLDYSLSQPDVVEFKQMGQFTTVHLDVFSGQFVATPFDDAGGPDSFEIEIGNRVAHAVPFADSGRYFRQLQKTWLPYYDERLRVNRLAMAFNACLDDLDHIPPYIQRGLYFQAFDRLYKAFQEFLQAVFIAHSTYPIAYNKWIREQVVNWLGLPELYAELPHVLSINQLDSAELEQKADLLRTLMDKWA